MSAALAAAIVRNRPAIGSRHTYTVTFRQGAKEYTTTRTGEITAHCGRCVVVTIPDYGAILAAWPGWWQDGTMKEAV